jgi:hypothetical protein
MESGKNIIKYIDQLPDILNRYGLSPGDICIVGSSVLSAFGLRENHDLDFVIEPRKRQLLLKQYKDVLKIMSWGLICFNENIEAVYNQYNIIGISDSEIVNNAKYNILFNGWKIARIELVLAKKAKRGRKKDTIDLDNAEEFLSCYSDFDWDFFRKYLSFSIKPPRSSHYNRLIKIVKLLILNPKRLFTKAKSVIRNRIETVFIPVHSELAAITDFMISPATLLGMQFKKNFGGGYLFMRYLTIDHIEKGIDTPFKEYDAMQKNRVNRDTVEDFYLLITNIKNNGFSNKYPLSVDLGANIIDGSHRLACALYYNIDKISYTVIQSNSNIRYGLEWFKRQGFEEAIINELEIIRKKLFLLKGIYFCATIWGAAKIFFDDISSDIESLYKIVYQEDLFLGDNYGKLIDDIYAIDDIDKWKVLVKKQFLYQSPHEIRFILFEIPTPDFIIKQKNHSYLSSKGAMLKKMIRKKYCSKIQNYFYDIIIHIGDNYEHNGEMIRAIEKYTAINIEEIK